MYHMMRKRNNVGTVITLEGADDHDLQAFLQRFDIAKECVVLHFQARPASELVLVRTQEASLT